MAGAMPSSALILTIPSNTPTPARAMDAANKLYGLMGLLYNTAAATGTNTTVKLHINAHCPESIVDNANACVKYPNEIHKPHSSPARMTFHF